VLIFRRLKSCANDHDLELVTFDQHFADIARLTPLRARILNRALK
jgi:hypothetical protein